MFDFTSRCRRSSVSASSFCPTNRRWPTTPAGRRGRISAGALGRLVQPLGGAPDRRFYAYLYSEEEKAFVGEAAYHFDEELDGCIVDVIVHSRYRGRGYGTQGLQLLCEQGRRDGLEASTTTSRTTTQVCSFSSKTDLSGSGTPRRAF